MDHPISLSAANGSDDQIHKFDSAQQMSVALVGNPLSFSRHFIDSAHAEISDVRFIRIDDRVRLLHTMTLHSQIPLIVLDENTVQTAISHSENIFAFSEATHVAIAYRHNDFAARILSERSRDVINGKLSLFPLNAQLDVVISVIKILLCGQQYIPCELSLQRQMQQSGPNSLPHSKPQDSELTERELQVLTLVAEGKQNKLVAHQLGLSEHTVKLHMHHVLTKLGLANRTEASTWYHANLTPNMN